MTYEELVDSPIRFFMIHDVAFKIYPIKNELRPGFDFDLDEYKNPDDVFIYFKYDGPKKEGKGCLIIPEKEFEKATYDTIKEQVYLTYIECTKKELTLSTEEIAKRLVENGFQRDYFKTYRLDTMSSDELYDTLIKEVKFETLVDVVYRLNKKMYVTIGNPGGK